MGDTIADALRAMMTYGFRKEYTQRRLELICRVSREAYLESAADDGPDRSRYNSPIEDGCRPIRFRLPDGTLHSHKGRVDGIPYGHANKVRAYLTSGQWTQPSATFEVMWIKDGRFSDVSETHCKLSEVLLVWEPTHAHVLGVDCVIDWVDTWVSVDDYVVSTESV